MGKHKKYLATLTYKSFSGIRCRGIKPVIITSLEGDKFKIGEEVQDIIGNRLRILTGNKILIWLWKKLFR